ncbi:putative disease resistance protein RGA4 [Lotus japonicus]|uniref:putative disease resistance protein RGA4 n=1 Tax=Lotus japonicus TaxID=34305 RepID=UPI00258ED910|nr:putative disease resistance protein RGA4 [Lotus japonicus]
MAEALLGAVFEKLISLAQNEFATISGIKGKAEKLSHTLELIKAVVEDAEKKEITNKSIKVWLQQLKDAVYILDDILDECSIESLRLKGLSSLKPKNIKFRYEIGNRLKEIARRFDEIADCKNKFALQEGVRERSTEVAEWRQTSSFIPQPKLYGREDDKRKIMEFLLSQARESDFLSIYPIVGLGGMGKTTLAQMVYNDDQGPDLVIHQTKECLDRMGEWCQSHHAASGLTKRVLESTISEREAEKQVIDFVKKHVGKYTPLLAGNSIYVDLQYLKKYMPELAGLFPHVLVDVSSVKALCIRWYPRDQKKAPIKENKHRALDDIRESIEELRYYKANIFKPKSKK